jgi:protein-disulfide isomerase
MKTHQNLSRLVAHPPKPTNASFGTGGLRRFAFRSFAFFLASLLLALFGTGTPAALSDEFSKLPWALLPKVSTLNDDQRSVLFEDLRHEPDYGECKDTIMQCLQRTKPDQTAVRMTNFCAYLLSLGVPPIYMRPTIRERAKFFNAPKNLFTFKETPILGNERAQITIVEFADFQCTYCASTGPLLKKLVEESNGSVRLLFKHFPLKKHAGSLLASKAAQAAYRQGKFWEMYDLLFKNMTNQNMENFLKWARELGLDVEKFKRDMEDPKLLQIIERDTMEGVRANLQATPALFINGKFYQLRHDEYFLKDVIDEEAERLKIKLPYKDWAYP